MLAVSFFRRRARLRSRARGKLGRYVSLNEIHVLYMDNIQQNADAVQKGL